MKPDYEKLEHALWIFSHSFFNEQIIVWLPTICPKNYLIYACKIRSKWTFMQQEKDMLGDMVKKLVAEGAAIVLCQKGIDDVTQHFACMQALPLVHVRAWN